MVKAVLLDMAGVLYQGDHAVTGSVPALARLRDLGLPLRFVTNTSRRSRSQLLSALEAMGFSLSADELFTAPCAAAAYLEARGLSPLLLVDQAVREDFPATRGAPDAVVIADSPDNLDYANLDHAFRLLMAGAPLVAIGDNRYFRADDGLHLDAGPFVRALEYAAGVDAVIAGKPASTFFLEVLADLGVSPEDTVMVGDDVMADVAGARRVGMDAVLVRTGKYRADDERQLTPPAPVVANLAAAVDWIERL
jgi:HAD superfamily hydrolase (TIGR01458 family)